MKHKLIKINGGKWCECDHCGCIYRDDHWWINNMKSKQEPECSADNLDWERNATKDSHEKVKQNLLSGQRFNAKHTF